MAQSAPSHMFARLVNVWRDLSFRSDVDDIVLEILGRFSLDRIYAETTADRQSYQRLIVTLLTQLNAIFYIQRLTLPPANDHFGARLGLLVSWEVAMRTFEMLLHTIVDGREGLWDRRLIIDKSLGQLLSFGLRFLVLHPGMGAGEDAYGQADRFARLHDLLEQVLDSFPGPQTVLLLACKDIAGQLASDPRAFANKPRQNLPNLASEMYPLSECMSPQSIMQLATQVETPENWVDGVFSLRDVAYFTSAASMQYTVNQETRDMDLHAASWRTRDAVFEALELLPLPAYVSKPHLASTFANVFSIALPETMSTYEWDEGEEEVNNIAYDALDMLCTRLSERQVLHRISDGAVTHSVSQVLDILTPSGSSSNRFGAPAGLYVVNCPHCHSFDSMQMRSYNVHFRRSPEEYITLPAQSTCLECREPISYAREISLFRRTWELLRHLETDTRASTIERHVSSHFQLRPLSRRGTDSLHSQTQSLHSPMSPTHANVTAVDFAIRQATSSASGQRQNTSSPTHYPESTTSQEQPSRPERLTSDTSVYTTSGSDNHPYHQYHHQQQSQQLHNHKPSVSYANTSSPVSSEPRHTISGWPSRRKSEAAPDKGKLSRWKFSLGSSRKSTQAAAGNNSGSGDSSSLSSASPDPQKLEDIPLDGLFSVQKSSKGKRVVHTSVSTTSSLVLFWAQATLQIWDAATSPPSMVQAIFADNPCLLAAVGTSLVAYITGSREQRLTLRIVSLADPATSTVEYRMPSTHWCRSIAIDPIENYVAVGFDGAAVRFYKTRSMQSPREDRLHGHIHLDCKNCASVSTLSFSPDGLALLASTRSPKTGVIQLYLWRFPFLECNELLSCRYPVPLYESEDSGVSSVLFKSGTDREDDTVCITTWTQSGTPILVNPRTGHKTDIKSDPSSGGAGKLGTRIQCAAFSPSSGQLAVVNNKGNLYLISYQSTPMEIRRLCASKDLPAKTTSFGMNFITEHGDDYVVLAWADAAKKAGWVKKVPVIPQLNPANRLDEVIELAQYPMGTTITGADLAGSFSLSGTSLSTTNSNSQPAELPVQGQVQMATELEAEPAPPMSPTNFDAPVKKTATKIPGFS